MCLPLGVCVCSCICVGACVCACICGCACAPAYMCAYVCASSYLCACVCKHGVRVSAPAYAFVRVPLCVRPCVCAPTSSPMRILSLANSSSLMVTRSLRSTAAFSAAWFTRFSSSAPVKPTVPRAMIPASTAGGMGGRRREARRREEGEGEERGQEEEEEQQEKEHKVYEVKVEED